jgi:hypothetical protein
MAQHEQASDGDPATEHTHGNACPRLTCWLAGGEQFVNNFTMAFCNLAKIHCLFLLGRHAIPAAEQQLSVQDISGRSVAVWKVEGNCHF